MRQYTDEKLLINIKCNKCGKDINVENEIIKEGVFSVDYKWGYFSKKDGEIHSFDLCEECYEDFIKKFAIEVTCNEENEFL